MNKWIATAMQTDIVIRSAKVAGVVGSLLTMINHGDTIWFYGLDLKLALKVGLTYCVPYGVSTFASVSTTLNRK